ncbi:Nonsense-mediated mRNA decay protein 5 [Coemansia sp. RSA 552]|nr:Nonsense-mediated mRNA decay protein 5 [Coemansia sp. RSA 552]
MDLNQLVSLFDSTLHPDPSVREGAEKQLQQLESQDGFLALLLRAIASADLQLGTRQAAAIYFKNRVRRSWNPTPRATEQHAPIGENDRTVTRSNILSGIVVSPQAIKLQLTECLGIILKYDFPERWPQFTVELRDLLNSEDTSRVYTGLLALLELVKRYRYTTNRDVLNEAARELFPRVQKIADEALASDDELAMRMVWLAFKSYLNTIQTGLPVPFQELGNLVAWGTSFIKMIEKPVAFDKDTIDENAAREPVWKAKKWAVRSINRLYSRYGNPALLPSSNAKKHAAFAKLFTADFMPQILQVYLRQIEGFTAGAVWMSERIRGLIAQFMSDCVKEKSAWKLLKPHVEGIVEHFIFPQMCFTQEDQELWEDNPPEYVSKRIDPIDDFGSAASAVTNLLVDLAFDRKKTTLSPILVFINNVLNRYAQSNEQARDARAKDGALNMMGALCETLISPKSNFASSMPEFLLTHVVPEFKSPNKFLRARALDTYCRFSSVEFPRNNQQIKQEILNSIFSLLQDPEIPVRVHAALALRPMIEDDDCQSVMVKNVPVMVDMFMSLTNSIDSDTIMPVIEEFIAAYADEMHPYAIRLGEMMEERFMHMMKSVVALSNEEDSADANEISERTIASMSILKAMGTLVLHLETARDVVHSLEKVTLGMSRFVFDNQLIDLYEDSFELVDCTLFTMKTITPMGWGIFESLHDCFKRDGIDFIEEMLPALENFVKYGMDHITQSTDVQARLFDIIETVMKSDRVGENDRVSACKLAESLMLYGRGKIDGMIPGFLSLAVTYLQSPEAIKTRKFLVTTLEVVLNALYYNPVITVGVLHRYQWTGPVFSLMVQNVDKFSRVHDKKLLIVGLTAILAVPGDQLPQELQSGLQQVFECVLHTFKSLGTAVEQREAFERMYEGEDDEDFDEDELAKEFEWDSADNEDDEDTADNPEVLREKYLNELATQAGKALGSDGFEEEDFDLGSDDEDDDFFGASLDDVYALESPLDEINAYTHFQDQLSQVQNANQPVYSVLLQSLSAENTQFVQSLMEEAARQRNSEPSME